MAPAALDTLVTHFKDTGRNPSYYDGIFTGDLGTIGKEILTELSLTKGYNIKNNYDKIHSDSKSLIYGRYIVARFIFNNDKRIKFEGVTFITNTY